MLKRFIVLLAAVLLMCGCEKTPVDDTVMDCCDECGDEYAFESLLYAPDYGHICANCFVEKKFLVCLCCCEIYVPDGLDARCGYCSDCSDRYTWWCSECENPYLVSGMAELEPGQFLCGSCLAEKLHGSDALDGVEADFDKFDPWPGDGRSQKTKEILERYGIDPDKLPPPV